MKKNTLLKKYGDKIKFKKEDNLLRAEDFQSIEIVTEYSALTHKNIVQNSMKRDVKKDEEEFDKTQYMLSAIQHCVRFDGKKLTSLEITRLEHDFANDLYFLLTEEDLQEQSETEHFEN